MTHASLFDLVLRDDDALTGRLLDDDRLVSTTQGLVGLVALGFAVHGVAVALTVGGEGTGPAPWWWMPLAFPAAFLAALALSLPSFFFITQLAGLDASFRLVTALALRVLARTSVLLLGVIPFYVPVALAARLGVFFHAEVVAVGYALPFAVGLAGVYSLLRSLEELTRLVPLTHPRRGRILWRATAAWSLVFTAVAPVALWWIVQQVGWSLT